MTERTEGRMEEGGTPPVFVPCRNLPELGDSGNPFTVRELCAAAEKTSGYNSILGAQRIGGLWRIYPKGTDSRVALLLKGIDLRKQSVTLYDKNPFIVRTQQGEEERPTTKLVIGNIPISYSNNDIEKKLAQIGCNILSKLLMERDRDDKGGLTRWLTGRRFVYIETPDRPLPEKISIGPATATLYHREQRLNTENATCSRCLSKGHRASACSNDVVCRTCKQPGHKRGHPSCPLHDDSGDRSSQPQPPPPATTAADTPGKEASSASTATSPSARTSKGRGRDKARPTQARLNFGSARSQSRSREKRPRSSPPSYPDSPKTARTADPSPRRQILPIDRSTQETSDWT